MNETELINLLEELFVGHHNLMEETNKLHNYEQARYHATIECEIARMLAKINDSSEDIELERLYKKFNLFKSE